MTRFTSLVIIRKSRSVQRIFDVVFYAVKTKPTINVIIILIAALISKDACNLVIVGVHLEE